MNLKVWMRQAAVKYLEGMAQCSREYHRNSWSSYPGLEEPRDPGVAKDQGPADATRDW